MFVLVWNCNVVKSREGNECTTCSAQNSVISAKQIISGDVFRRTATKYGPHDRGGLNCEPAAATFGG